MKIFQQMMVLFIIMFIGFIAYKKQIITDETSKKISSIVVNIANPALILSSVMGNVNSISIENVGIAMAVAVILFTALIAVAGIIPRLLAVSPQSSGIYSAMTVFSNIGFMGFPIISAVYGQEALLYGSLFILPYNVLIYTYGIHLINSNDEKSRVKIGRIFNIGVIACIAALIIFLCHIKLPEIAATTINILSGLTAPLSMMVIGASLATISLSDFFNDNKLLIFTIIKQFALPAIGTYLISLFVSDQMLCGVAMIMLSTPVGSMTAMLAQEYDGNYELAAKGVTLTTIVSVVSIPVVSAIVL